MQLVLSATASFVPSSLNLYLNTDKIMVEDISVPNFDRRNWLSDS